MKKIIQKEIFFFFVFYFYFYFCCFFFCIVLFPFLLMRKTHSSKRKSEKEQQSCVPLFSIPLFWTTFRGPFFFFFFLFVCLFVSFLRPSLEPPSVTMIKGKQGKKEKETHGAIHEFAMNKSLGQNLLKNPQILDSIIEKAQLKSTDTVFFFFFFLFFFLSLSFPFSFSLFSSKRCKVMFFLLGSRNWSWYW